MSEAIYINDVFITRGALSPMTMTTEAPSLQARSLSGMLLAAMAFALLTSVDTIFKLLATGHPAYQILVVNGCFALVPILVWSGLTGGLKRLHTTRLVQHYLRGCISVASAFAAIYAYSRLPLTDFYAIVFSGPLLVTAMSAIWLHETIGRQRWIAVIAGFCGVLVVTNPLSHFVNDTNSVPNYVVLSGQAAALLSVFCYALSVIMIRHMRTRETNITFSFYGYVASISISGCLWLIHDTPQPLEFIEIIQLAVSGTLAGIASICLMTAYHRTPVSLVAPFQYTQIIWGAAAGYLLWAHAPDINLVLGAAIVTASGLFVIYSEVRMRELGRLAHSDNSIQATKSERVI